MNDLDRAIDRYIDATATGPTIEATRDGYAKLEAWLVEDSARIKAEQDAWLREQEAARRLVNEALEGSS